MRYQLAVLLGRRSARRISVKWGISGWPTVDLVDAKGVIRNDSLVGHVLDQSVEALVTEIEAAAR
jgi:hypothetical protein